MSRHICIKISAEMEIAKMTLAEIVTQKPATARFFEEISLDYCCGGKRTLEKALSDRSELLEPVVNRLREIFFTTTNQEKNAVIMSMIELSDYIVNTHHTYVKDQVPVILAHLEKVAMKHGQRFPNMVQARDLFVDLSRELLQHMLKEEIILFPRIKQLENGAVAEDGHSIIENPIKVMEFEHENAGELMRKIREITGNYTPPEDACMTFRLSLDELRQFEEDLHKHVHLENNILFPAAFAREKELQSAS